MHQRRFVFASVNKGRRLISASICWGLRCVYDADRKTRHAGLEALLGICASARRDCSRLSQFRQGLIEGPDACVVEVSRLMEPHAYGTGMGRPGLSAYCAVRWLV